MPKRIEPHWENNDFWLGCWERLELLGEDRVVARDWKTDEFLAGTLEKAPYQR